MRTQGIIQRFIIVYQISLSRRVTAVTKLDVGTRAQARQHTYDLYTENGHTHLDNGANR